MLDQERKAARNEVLGLQKEIKNMRSKIMKDKKVIETEWNKLKKKESLLINRERNITSKETELKKKEIKIEEDKHAVELIKSKFDEQKKDIERRKSELEVEGFQKYLQEKLKNVELINEKELLKKEETKIPFQELIDDCKQNIIEGNISTAKEQYLELKSKFETSNLSGAQKELAYNSIRELYDDIMLNL